MASERKSAPRQPSEPAGPALAALPASILTADEQAGLQSAAALAIENNATFIMRDAANRVWFVGIDIVQNRSTVLVQARRGQVAHGLNLPTPTISPAVVASAIAEIDARSFD